VNKIFSLMDLDQDGRLSMAEFRDGSLRDPSIVDALSFYDGLI
jgi:neuronal calcium sensor 1